MIIEWVPLDELDKEGYERYEIKTPSDFGIKIKVKEKIASRVIREYKWDCPKCDNYTVAESMPIDLVASHCWRCKDDVVKMRDDRREAKRTELMIAREWEIARKYQRLFSELDLGNVELVLSLGLGGNLHSINVILPNDNGDDYKLLIYIKDGNLSIRNKEARIDYVNEYSTESILLSSEDMAEIEKKVLEVQ